MSKLAEILEKIKAAEATRSLDLTTLQDPRTRPGWEVKVKQAAAEVQSLEQEYKTALLQGAAGILVSGPDQFVTILADFAADTGNALLFRADDLYDRLSYPVERLLGADRYVRIDPLVSFIQELAQIKGELGIARMVEPDVTKYANRQTLATRHDVVDFVRKMVREALGDELNCLYIAHKVFSQAKAIGYDQAVVPVVITGWTADEADGLAKGLFGGQNNHVVEAQSVDTAPMIKVFSQLKEKLMPTTPKKYKKNKD